MQFSVLPAMVLVLAVSMTAASDLSGVVRNSAGDPTAGAVVSLIDLRLEATTSGDGSYHFTNIPPGNYLVSVADRRFGNAVERVDVAGDKVAILDLELDLMVHTGAVSVTGSGRARNLDELTQPVTVLAGGELLLRRKATLGETLAEQPGISATGYGRGASRPVIRGLGGDRIRVLENGLDAGDVSSVGPDHAGSSEVLTAKQVEVVRGAATLLYGGTAVGGVVNVLDGRVPDRVPTQLITGTVDLEGGTVADEMTGALRLDGGVGRLAWHVDAFARDAGDYDSPAPRPLESGHDHDHDGHDLDEHEAETGRVANSFVEGSGAAVGLSWVGRHGYLGVAVSGADSDYGVPGHVHPGHEHDAEAGDGNHGVFVELEQRRFDLHGRIDHPLRGFEAVTVRGGWRDYEHVEMDGDVVGTRFNSELFEARVDGVLAPIAGFEGTVGLHLIDRDFAAVGVEAFVEPTTTRRLAVFLHEQAPAKPWGFEFGLRAERQSTDIEDPELRGRNFATVSAAGGVSYALSKIWLVSLTATRSERAPTAEELFSDGPHVATFAYEVGDPNLNSEQANGIDLTVRASGDLLEGSLSVFRTGFEGFIYLVETDDFEDGLPVHRFSQGDAVLTGFELHGDYEVYHSGDHHVHLGFVYDQVRAELSAGGNLPRIPPRSCRLQIVYLNDRWTAQVEGRWVDEQNHVADHEQPTPSFVMLGASLGYRFYAGRTMHEILLKASNLTNEAAYNHVSFVRDVAPLPGRNLALAYRVDF